MSDQPPDDELGGHAEAPKRILDLAVMLFESTQAQHALDDESQEVLESAALLRNTPLPRSKMKSAQADLALVFTQAGLNLSEQGRRELAAVLAYQQGKLKRKDFAGFGLTPPQERETLTIAAILEIAESLDHLGRGAARIQKIEPADDGLWIVVAGLDDPDDAAAVQKKSRLWEKLGYPRVEILEPGQAALRRLPFPEPLEKIGIQRDDTLAEAGRKVMRFQFAQMLRHEEGTRAGEDIEALHDMRVATRRLRAAFEVFGDSFEPGVLKPHLKGLRRTGRLLGAVRDLDVFMEKAYRYIETLPEERRNGLDPLLESWRSQRDAARALMLEYLNSREYYRFKRDFNIFLNTPLAGERPLPDDRVVPHLVNQLVPALIYERIAAVRAYGSLLEDAPIERLHALRIEFKKLRYTVEYFREVLGKRAFDVIESIKKLQDHLGDLTDAQVATQILREFVDSWEENQRTRSIHERENIEEVFNYLSARYAERHQLLIAFPSAWQEHFHTRAFRRNVAQAVSVL
jgi:CHAD domain-containing protein